MKFKIKFYISLMLAGTALAQKDTSLLPQDYKCGISIRYSGTQGVDWIAEDQFHNTLQNNRRTVYIRDTTKISLFHNEINTVPLFSGKTSYVVGANGPDGIADSGDEGIIRYRFDGELNRRIHWGSRQTDPWGDPAQLVTAYTAPFSLSESFYAPTMPSVPVVGTTGDNGQPITDDQMFYAYGSLDSAGDEWHSMEIGDDDGEYMSTVQNQGAKAWCSDGKRQLFVVNPKTPCITVARTGNAQFYTTPATAWGSLTIRDQTTYILPRAGTASITLTDIYGGVVEYRIGGGSWLNNGTNTVTLADSAFSSGSNTLQCRYAATPAVIRTRTVVKNPAFPSAGESHGNLMWADSNEYDAIVSRLSTANYSNQWDKMKNDSGVNYQGKWDTHGMQGLRTPGIGDVTQVTTQPFTNAFVARVLGWDAVRPGAVKTYAEYAKEMLLDSRYNLDRIGVNIPESQISAPDPENRDAGYREVSAMLQFAPAYDLLIAHYRSDQHANGITPIEDYFIRDQMAQYVYWLQQGAAKRGIGGLWSVARAAGAMMCAITMADYDTPYYGTSGYNGTTTATHLWAPYPDYPETWKSLFTDIAPVLHSYPNRSGVFGPDRPDSGYALLGNSGDQYGYFHASNLGYWNLMQIPYSVITNLSVLHTSKDWPVITQAYLYSALGTMKGSLGASPDLSYHENKLVYNTRHPSIEGPGRQALVDRNLNKAANSWLQLIWYDDGSQSLRPPSPRNLRTIK